MVIIPLPLVGGAPGNLFLTIILSLLLALGVAVTLIIVGSYLWEKIDDYHHEKAKKGK